MNCPKIKDKLRKDNEERGIEVKIHLTKACYILYQPIISDFNIRGVQNGAMPR